MRAPGLETLLSLDGTTYALDTDHDYVVKIAAKRIPATPEKPHGLDYSLTLHGPHSGDPFHGQAARGALVWLSTA